MTVPKSPPGFRRRLLRAQRVGRLVLLVFVLAGAAGLFGGLGPLSGQRVVVGEQGLLSLPRFVRLQTPFVLIAENSGGDERRNHGTDCGPFRQKRKAGGTGETMRRSTNANPAPGKCHAR